MATAALLRAACMPHTFEPGKGSREDDSLVSELTARSRHEQELGGDALRVDYLYTHTRTIDVRVITISPLFEFIGADIFICRILVNKDSIIESPCSTRYVLISRQDVRK